MKISRREFFTKSIQGAAIITLPAVLGTVLESCTNANPASAGSGSSSNLQTINVSPSNNTILLNIDSSSPLANTGSAALLQYQNNYLLVDRPTKDAFNVLSAICTHQGCVISMFDSSSQQFVCPCHGSKFNTTGKVTQGPAGSPLRQYQNQFANNQLDIQL